MNLKKLESYLRVNLLGPGPRFIKKNLPGCGLMKVEKHWCRGTFLDIYKFPASKFCSELISEMKCYMFWAKFEGSWVNRIGRATKK